MKAAWFTLALAMPSLGLMQKYGGLAGVLAYVVLVSVIGPMVWRHAGAYQENPPSRARERWLLALTLAGVALVIFAVYPVVNSSTGGTGSDRDDALDIATRALLAGRYPYAQHTYLDNPITPMPGSLLLAIPFVLLGRSAWQNLFWLSALAVTMTTRTRSAFLAMWVVLLLSPVVSHEVIVGGDLLSNSIFLMLFTVWLADAAADPQSNRLRLYGLAVLFGIGLSSRLIFMPVVPLLLIELRQRSGHARAILVMGIALAAFTMVTLPFYFQAPSEFTPLQTVNVLSWSLDGASWVALVVVLATAVVTVVAVRQSRSWPNWLLRGSAAVLTVPIVCAVLAKSFNDGRVNLVFCEYGLSFLFFGLAGTWPGAFLPGRDERADRP